MPKFSFFDLIFFSFDEKLGALRERNKTIPISIRRHFEFEIIKKAKTESEKASLEVALKKVVRILSNPPSNESQESFEIPDNVSMTELFNAISYPRHMETFIRNMGLVYLIAEFEAFLGLLLRSFYRHHPEALRSSQKSITFSEITELSEKENILNYVIGKEIDSLLYEDIEKINQYLVSKFNIDLSNKVGWNRFKETFYRRNIVIHNECMPDDIYIKKTNYKGRRIRLLISQNYLQDRITVIRSFSSILRDQFNSKLQKKE